MLIPDHHAFCLLLPLGTVVLFFLLMRYSYGERRGLAMAAYYVSLFAAAAGFLAGSYS